MTAQKGSETGKPDFTPEELRAAKMATLMMTPYSNEASAAVDALFDQTVAFQKTQGTRNRAPNAHNAQTMKATIGALIGDLLEASLNVDSGGYCYRASHKDKIKDTLATSRHYEKLKLDWSEMGLMEVVNGFQGTDDFDGKIYRPTSPHKRPATRLRATPLLLKQLADFGITPQSVAQHFRSEQKQSDPVVLKAPNIKGIAQGKVLTKYEKSATYAAIEADMIEINSFLSEWEYSFGMPPELYRVFNEGTTEGYQWDFGGRFFGPGSSYINWKSEARKSILIGGEPTVEIDIKACQLTILHGLFGLNYEVGVDLYQIDGEDREEVKQLIIKIVGKGRVGRLKGPLVEKVLDRFPFLNELEARGLNTLRLQAIDSAIMNETLLILKRQFGIPALPVHDCIIVRAGDIDTAMIIFGDVFCSHIGIRPTFKVER